MRLLAIDWILFWFLGLLLFLTWGWFAEIPQADKLSLLYASSIALILGSIYLTRNWQFSNQLLMRCGFCLLLVPILFSSLGFLIHYISPDDRHWQLLQWDRYLFGFSPIYWAKKLEHPLLTEYSQISYSSFYFLPLIVGIFLWRNKNWSALEILLYAVVLGFFFSYLGYILIPAKSPNLVLPGLWQEGLFLSDFLQRAIFVAEINKYDCFPSGHFQLTLITLVMAWRFNKAAFYSILPLGVGLMFGTVYLNYHYLIDLVAGLAFAMATLWVFPRK